jgi:hypothetical protein
MMLKVNSYQEWHKAKFKIQELHAILGDTSPLKGKTQFITNFTSGSRWNRFFQFQPFSSSSIFFAYAILEVALEVNCV